MEEKITAIVAVNSALPVFEEIHSRQMDIEDLNVRLTEQAAARSRRSKWLSLPIGVAGAYALDRLIVRLVYSVWRIHPLSVDFIMLGLVVAAFFVIRSVARNRLDRTGKEELETMGRMEALNQEINDIFESNTDVIECIPRDYRFYDAVSYFERALSNGRADSMKEAIAAYDEYAHRAALERDSQEALNQQYIQTEQLKNIEQSNREIERSARRAASNSSRAASFSALNFLSNL